MDILSLDPSTNNYCVMGNPVAHSKSPQIHTAFAKQTGQQMHYQAILVEEGKFPTALAEFQKQGGKGLNITLPYKTEAWSVCDILTNRAERAQAVNTIWFNEKGERCGDNTDGAGLICDLKNNHSITINDMDILIIGAGGAVRGILGPLFDQHPAKIVITNRTLSKAEQLARIFSDRGRLIVCDFNALVGRQFQLVINGTSASLQGEVPPLPDDLLAGDACCYDMFYSNEDTVFVSWAETHNASSAIDGLGMLVEQAAESFLLWRGVRPDTKQVIEMFRN